MSRLDKNLIVGVHIADGFRPEEGEAWVSETLLRDTLPGDGKVPCREWTQAVRATGYNGSFSAEILGDTLRESNLRGIAVEALRRMKVLVAEHS